MKVGLFGGTFDPIHIGHLLLAEHACEALAFDAVWFMPAADPPHKSRQPLATGVQRLEMIRLAIEGNALFHVTDIEMERGGVSYTIDTIEELQRRFPDHAFSFLMGADMVNYLPKWHRIDELAERINFVGVGRPGTTLQLDHLPAHIRDQVTMLEVPLFELSSTTIRERVSEDKSIRYRVPDRVHEFIQRNDLYESKP
ncbi:nicotinate-nucleotide adenylyltransferase [Paenibacillus guangzhouensis]|uniref:nicotinate-nucleotide adenylyltransferase n=1 Tax=Paenibacillus guangzhouensis TaxID=1473112 RepID=UPI0012670951|nr:nicotinate-nucleotide adenylyltransferase [Paenibacillus guangzhouensis]